MLFGVEICPQASEIGPVNSELYVCNDQLEYSPTEEIIYVPRFYGRNILKISFVDSLTQFAII